MNAYNKEIAPKANVEMILFSLERNPASGVAWAVKEKFPWPIVEPKNHKRSGLAKFRKRGGVPYYILIDKRGKQLAEGHGSHTIFSKLKNL